MVDRIQASRGQPSATLNYDELSRADIATDVYRAFRDAGFSDQQSQALTAEINRENSLRPELLFGSHTDPSNEAKNVGMLSFQGDRAPAVLGYLRERGLADDAGNITPGYESLQAQAQFIRQEMETDPSYAETRKTFLSNPNVDPETAHRVLGDNYIRWRRTDPEFRDSGYNRIGEGYGLLTGQELDANTTRNLRPVARPEREEQAENKSFLDSLPSALAYMDLSGMMEAKRPTLQSPGVLRPKAGAGTRALKQMGLASLA
jgi:hypothetical protein